jgi:hypothetical protein
LCAFDRLSGDGAMQTVVQEMSMFALPTGRRPSTMKAWKFRDEFMAAWLCSKGA